MFHDNSTRVYMFSHIWYLQYSGSDSLINSPEIVWTDTIGDDIAIDYFLFLCDNRFFFPIKRNKSR